MKYDFHVGQRVRIREWDDMIHEYGGDVFGIRMPTFFTFVSEMIHLCGAEATISYIDGDRVELEDFDVSGETCWEYNVYMIEPAKSVLHIDFDEASFNALLDLS